jgi:hypothetical protein
MGEQYVDHMCENVGLPPLEETPPPHHLPTPRPSPSIFHDMMVTRTFSSLMMKCTVKLEKIGPVAQYIRGAWIGKYGWIISANVVLGEIWNV